MFEAGQVAVFEKEITLEASICTPLSVPHQARLGPSSRFVQFKHPAMRIPWGQGTWASLL